MNPMIRMIANGLCRALDKLPQDCALHKIMPKIDAALETEDRTLRDQRLKNLMLWLSLYYANREPATPEAILSATMYSLCYQILHGELRPIVEPQP